MLLLRAVAAALVLSVGPAGAAAKSAAAKRVALAHYQKGLKLFEANDYAGAQDEFEKASAAADAPEFLFNLAQCARNLGEHTKALDLYVRFLERKPETANRIKVEEYIAEEKRLIAPAEVERAPPPEVVEKPAPAPAPSRPPHKPARTGLWIGLGVGGGVLVAAAVALVLVLTLSPTFTDFGVHDLGALVRF